MNEGGELFLLTRPAVVVVQIRDERKQRAAQNVKIAKEMYGGEFPSGCALSSERGGSLLVSPKRRDAARM